MAEFGEIIASELMLKKIEPWKRIGGGCGDNNWAFKTDKGKIFAKISNDQNVTKLPCVSFWIIFKDFY